MCSSERSLVVDAVVNNIVAIARFRQTSHDEVDGDVT